MGHVAAVVQELQSHIHEEEWFEFKTSRLDADEIGEYISALSNAAASFGRCYAYLVWGIRDSDHEIIGTNVDYNQDVDGEPLKHYLSRQLRPDVNYSFEDETVGGSRVVLLSIPAAKNVPTAYKHVRYIRIGSSKEKLEKYPEKESYLFSVLRNGVPAIENTESEYQELNFTQLLSYYGARGIRLGQKTFKKNLGLLTDNGRYNLLAQLLSDNSHVPIRVAIFAGKTKADDMLSVREFGYQCLLYSLDEVLRYGDVLNIIQADERGRVVEREEVPLFDNVAFREAVINAFVHNKWISGNEPMFTVFADRVEILSRGTLPPEQTYEGFFMGESIPSNPRLSEIAMQLHISEKTGRGVPEITRRYGKGAFEFRENSIVVSIPFNWIRTVSETNNTSAPIAPAEYDATEAVFDSKAMLSRSQMLVQHAMRDNPNITAAQIAEQASLSVSTVNNAIAELKRLGMVERIGSRKTGHWRVKHAARPENSTLE